MVVERESPLLRKIEVVFYFVMNFFVSNHSPLYGPTFVGLR